VKGRTLAIVAFAVAAAPAMLAADLAAAYASEGIAALAWAGAAALLGTLLFAASRAEDERSAALFAVGFALAPIAVMARDRTPVIGVAAAVLALALAADAWRVLRRG
jgi:hypothetical protein